MQYQGSYATGIEVNWGKTQILTVQNGLENGEILASFVDRHQEIHGVTTMGGNLVAPGHIALTTASFTGQAVTYIGSLGGERTLGLEEVARIFTRSGINTLIPENLDQMIWEKLVMAGSDRAHPFHAFRRGGSEKN